jgi:hypothetical protein
MFRRSEGWVLTRWRATTIEWYLQAMVTRFYPRQALHRRDGWGRQAGTQEECIMMGATVVTTQFVTEHPNLRFCLRLGGREVVNRPIVEGGNGGLLIVAYSDPPLDTLGLILRK